MVIGKAVIDKFYLFTIGIGHCVGNHKQRGGTNAVQAKFNFFRAKNVSVSFGWHTDFENRCPAPKGFGVGVESGPVSGELRLRNGAAVKRINGGCKVVVDRATQRSEAGRNLPESGIPGGAQSFGVTESATVSPKVCAPGQIRFCQGYGEIHVPRARTGQFQSVGPRVSAGR